MNVMRNKKIHLVLPLMVVALLGACTVTPRQPAPIVDKTTKTETKPGVATASTSPRQMDSNGNYTVRRGDTLLQIAQDFGQSFRDLVAWNNLANPHDIRVDQVLRVVPPVTTNSVQAPNAGGRAGIEVRPLTAPSAAATAPNMTGPRGNKQPYSESTLAEMQKPEGGTPPAASASSQNEAKPQEKPREAAPPVAANEDASVSLIWPTNGKIIGTFDQSKKGIDITGKLGQPIVAAGAGKVMYAGSGIRGYGNLVIVKHNSNLLSAYAHNKTILVKEGQTVSKGEKIAEMGNTDSDIVKLHFEIRQQGKPVDPSKFLPTQ